MGAVKGGWVRKGGEGREGEEGRDRGVCIHTKLLAVLKTVQGGDRERWRGGMDR